MRVQKSSGLPAPLLHFVLGLAALTALSLLDAAWASFRAGHPVLGDLWIPLPGFDFYDYTPRFPLLHRSVFFTFTAGGSFPWIYPAPAIFVLYPFYLFARPTRWHAAYACFTLLGLCLAAGCAVWFGRALRKRDLGRGSVTVLLGSLFVLGWPLYFALQRGNIEVFLWVGVAGVVVLFAKRRYVPAALLLGVVGSVKTYPLLLVGLLLLGRRFRETVLCLVTAGATTLFALHFLDPDIGEAWRAIGTGIAQWTTITTGRYFPSGVGPDHSLVGLLRQCTLGAILQPPHALTLCLATAGALTTGVFFGRMRHMPVANQTLFILCAAILLPPTSYDYTLLLLFIPWGWVVLLCVERWQAGGSLDAFRPFLLLFALAFAPLTFFHTHGTIPVRFEGPARCVALLALWICSATIPLPGRPDFGSPASSPGLA